MCDSLTHLNCNADFSELSLPENSTHLSMHTCGRLEALRSLSEATSNKLAQCQVTNLYIIPLVKFKYTLKKIIFIERSYWLKEKHSHEQYIIVMSHCYDVISFLI